MIQIGGFLPFTTIDFPEKLACVLFLMGCPLRCAYCSNPHMLEFGNGEYDDEKIVQWLDTRRGKLDAVVLSGGEALSQGDNTIDYMRRICKMGFAIGLHTNGFYPEILARAMPLIDWVGLDVKAPERTYPKLCGITTAYERMLQSLDILLTSGKPFECRITCDPRFITKNDLTEITEMLCARGVKNIAVQKYIPHFETNATQTTSASRDQFFNDTTLRDKINSMFDSVCWRE